MIHLIFYIIIDESLRDYMFSVRLLFRNVCINLLKSTVLDTRINTLSVLPTRLHLKIAPADWSK